MALLSWFFQGHWCPLSMCSFDQSSLKTMFSICSVALLVFLFWNSYHISFWLAFIICREMILLLFCLIMPFMRNPTVLLSFSEWGFLFFGNGGVSQNWFCCFRTLVLPFLKGVVKKYVLIFSEICLPALYLTFNWPFSFLYSVAPVCSVWILLSALSLQCQTLSC